MGLFGIGKKKDDAPVAEATEASQSATAQTPASDGSEMKKCEMCGQEKPASEGKMMLEGAAFRCNDCAAKANEAGEEEHGEVCEFC